MNDYYKKKGFETIDVIEEIISRHHLPTKVAYNVAQAQKYIGRAGLKSDNYYDDLYKALDYLHRAVKGYWFHDVEAVDNG